MFRKISDNIVSKECWLRRRLSPLEAKECLRRLSLRAVSYLAGFTLIEMMAVVIIIGILTSIALPKYINYVERSRDVEAYVGLKAIYTAQKIYLLKNRIYTNNLNNLDVNISSEGKYFKFYSNTTDPFDNQIGAVGLAEKKDLSYRFCIYEDANVSKQSGASCPSY